ncbi:hypothetical protein ACOME3_002059 [Neoechinorhynchus agilis]
MVEIGVQMFDRILHLFKPLVLRILQTMQQQQQPSNLFDLNGPAYMLQAVMRVLERFSNINRQAANGEIVEGDSFYIPELSDIINVQEDYYIWLQSPNKNADHFTTFCQFPFVFDGVAKYQLLQADARIQQYFAHVTAVGANRMRVIEGNFGEFEMPELHLLVSRDNFVNETIEQLNMRSPQELKKPMRVFFYGEEGLDAGGVKKEFFLLLMKEILDPKYGMFRLFEESNCIWFNATSFEAPEMYGLVGKVCGLAIYNDTIIDLNFPAIL